MNRYLLVFSIWYMYVCSTTALSIRQANTPGTYKAAVYEHAVVTPVTNISNHSQAVEQMKTNLQEFEKQARIAATQNVDIMIFPEYGIYGFVRERHSMSHYIEDIPDVPGDKWIPCNNPKRYPQRLDVVMYLSCLAKNNTLYIVANYGDAKPCTTVDPNCPSDGQYQYNTNLVFDRSGTFIAKYHKQNLYYEAQFDTPVTPEHVFFDTSFGRFGVLTCFDILFREPMITLITKYNITDVAFPTAWMDALPYFSAIGYHSSVASAYNVNVLAANIHLPSFRFQGSGIYTPTGANSFYYSRSSPNGRLLINDVDVINQRQLTIKSEMDGFRKHSQNVTHDNTISVLVHKNRYNIVLLNEASANLTVCQKDVCCFIEYQIQGHDNDLYAFGVFSGNHKGKSYYIQSCLLFKCASVDVDTCGKLTFNASTRFDYLRMNGTFGTPFVTPQIVLTDNGTLRLPAKGSMKFKDDELTGTNMPYPLLESCLFGRVYDKDIGHNVRDVTNRGDKFPLFKLYYVLAYLIVICSCYHIAS